MGGWEGWEEWEWWEGWDEKTVSASLQCHVMY